MYMGLHAAQKVAKTVAGRAGLTIRYEIGKKQPRTSGRTIWVEQPSPEWSEDQIIEWAYTLYHEIGHNMPDCRDIFPLLKEIQVSTNSFFGWVLNLVDDYRQEFMNAGLFSGRDRLMSQGRASWISGSLETIGAEHLELSDERLKKISQMRDALWTWDALCRSKWQTDLTGTANKLYNKLSDQSKEWIGQLERENWIERFQNVTAREEYEALKELIEKVFDEPPEEMEQEAQAQKDKEAQGEGEGDGDGNEEGEGERVNYNDLKKHDHGDGERKPSYKKSSIDYNDAEYAPGYKMTPFDQMEIIREFTEDPDGCGYEEIMDQYENSGLSKKVKRLLQVKKETRYQGGHKQGRINSKSLYRTKLRNTNESERVFKRKVNDTELNTTVQVLTDMSGSMGGSKFANAVRCSELLNDCLDRIGVPTSIVGFTDDTTPIHVVAKNFTERLSSTRLRNRFLEHADRMCENADGESIYWGYCQLKQRPEKRKILLVISDGSPAGGHGKGCIYSFTRDIIKEIEKDKGVEVYAIGIEDDNVENLYTHHKVIHNANELENALFKVIKDKIIG